MESSTKCPQCDDLIFSNQSLEDHILTMHSVKCKECDKMFVSLQKLETHRKFDHSTTDKDNIPCKKCRFVFQTKSQFNEHLSGREHNEPIKVHNDSDDEDDDDEYFIEKGNFCGIIFDLFEDLDHHHSNYLRCYSCQICYHTEFQFQIHETCDQ